MTNNNPLSQFIDKYNTIHTVGVQSIATEFSLNKNEQEEVRRLVEKSMYRLSLYKPEIVLTNPAEKLCEFTDKKVSIPKTFFTEELKDIIAPTVVKAILLNNNNEQEPIVIKLRDRGLSLSAAA